MQSPAIHFFAKSLCIFFHPFTGKSILTARLDIQFDLPPNVLVELQKTVIL